MSQNKDQDVATKLFLVVYGEKVCVRECVYECMGGYACIRPEIDQEKMWVYFFLKFHLLLIDCYFFAFSMVLSSIIYTILQTNCAIDVTYYPFDTQTCTMKLLSWGLPSTELSLVRLWDEVNMESFL